MLNKIFRIPIIIFVILKYRLVELFFFEKRAKTFNFLKVIIFFTGCLAPDLTRGERVRKACEELGPIFIKFGQLLSTRLDILPVDIAKELVKLQDKVPPFSGDKAKKIIQEACCTSANSVFLEFDIVPIASASIAQVHPAKLQNGQEVVVKV